jgi:hypothetical protein
LIFEYCTSASHDRLRVLGERLERARERRDGDAEIVARLLRAVVEPVQMVEHEVRDALLAPAAEDPERRFRGDRAQLVHAQPVRVAPPLASARANARRWSAVSRRR